MSYYFTQRVYYGQQTDTMVSLAFVGVNGGCWVKEVLTPNGAWAHTDVHETFAEAYASIHYMWPVLLCEEVLD